MNYMLYVKALKIKKLITVVISTSLELFLRLVKRIVKELDLLVPWHHFVQVYLVLILNALSTSPEGL